jgi:SNF2 family DNA or RNA helicase
VKPRKYQAQDIKTLLQDPVGWYAADIGTGKSLVALKVFEALWKAKKVARCLIVATPRIMEHTWPDEIAKWTKFKYSVLHGGPVKIAKAMDVDVPIYLTTYDTFVKILESDALYDDVTMVIFDESHKLKSPSAKRFKTVKKHIKRFEYRLLMTGSPMPKSLEDLWSQSYLLDEGERLGKYISHFRNRWFQRSWDGFGWDPRPGVKDEIFEALSGLMLRREATKEAGIPEVTVNDLRITLPPKARKVYAELHEELITRVASKEVMVFNAGAAAMKVRQVCNGFVYDADHNALAVHTAKSDALADLIEGLDGAPLLVAYSFKEDARTLEEVHGIPCLTGLTGRQAKNMIASWNRGEMPGMAIHPDSAGEGLNLQFGGHHMCWYSLPWNPASYWQTIGRLARSGQEYSVLVHRLITEGTIEPRMARTLLDRAADQQDLFNAITQ